MLLALVDADYKFTYIDTGSNGRIRDGGVYRNATLSSALENNSLNIRKERKVDDFTKLPYVKVGDDAFPIKPCLIKPYPERNLSMEQRILVIAKVRLGESLKTVSGFLQIDLECFSLRYHWLQKTWKKFFLPVVLCIIFYARNAHLVILHQEVLINNV